MHFARLLTVSESKNRHCSTNTLLSTFASINNTRVGFGKYLGKVHCAHVKIPLKQVWGRTSSYHAPHHSAVKIFHRVVMDQQWVSRTKMFLKWNNILGRHGEENTQGLLKLNDILKWNIAWKILSTPLKRRVKDYSEAGKATIFVGHQGRSMRDWTSF